MFRIENFGDIIYKSLTSKSKDKVLRLTYDRLALNEQETARYIGNEILALGKSHSISGNGLILNLVKFICGILPARLIAWILKNILKRRMYSKWYNIHKDRNREFWRLLLNHENLQHELLSSFWDNKKGGAEMKPKSFFKLFFLVIGAYDVLLGGSFALFYKNIYAYLNITLPNHPGYIYVPALFLMSAGIGEFLISRNLLRNVDLAIVRLLMKLSFALAVFYCYFKFGVPNIFMLISIASIAGVIINILFIHWVNAQNLKV